MRMCVMMCRALMYLNALSEMSMYVDIKEKTNPNLWILSFLMKFQTENIRWPKIKCCLIQNLSKSNISLTINSNANARLVKKKKKAQDNRFISTFYWHLISCSWSIPQSRPWPVIPCHNPIDRKTVQHQHVRWLSSQGQFKFTVKFYLL